MSGHSKWSKVKHQKEATDAVKGKIFTKMANAIIIAVATNGGNPDPDSNFRLRLIIDKARGYNMPKDKIDRAIERGTGKSDGALLSEVVYEAIGPGGVGIIIEAATDNKQRTVANIKNLLERNGGILASSGAVSYAFKNVGKIEVDKIGKSFDEMMEIGLRVGAEDLEDNGETFDMYTKAADVHKVKENISKEGMRILSAELVFKPMSTVAVTDKHTADRILNLLSLIEEAEDVQKVFANFDIPEEFLN